MHPFSSEYVPFTVRNVVLEGTSTVIDRTTERFQTAQPKQESLFYVPAGKEFYLKISAKQRRQQSAPRSTQDELWETLMRQRLESIGRERK